MTVNLLSLATTLGLVAAGAACTVGDARPALDWTLRVEPLAS